MGFQKRLTSLLAISALAIAAGCSGAGSQIPSSAQSFSHPSQPVAQLSMNHHFNTSVARSSALPMIPGVRMGTNSCPATGLLTFVSDASNNVMDIFSGSTMCGQVSGLSEPQGMDGNGLNGHILLANTAASTILEFKAPYTSSFKTLNDPSQYPAGVAQCNGFVAVTNIISTAGGPGSISIYKGTATSPTATLSDPNAAREYFPACDTKGNLFSTYSDSSGVGHVNEWKLHTGSAIDLPITLSFPGGLQFEDGTLEVGDQTARTVGLYHSPFSTAYKTINLSQASDPVTFFTYASDTKLITADAGTATAQIYKFLGANGTYSSSITVGGQPIGVAQNKDDDE